MTTDDGLSDNKILSIYQAKDGDIWIGTDKGINRYNGIFDEGSLYGSVNSILESPTGEIIVRVVVTEQQSRDGVPFTVTSVKVYLFDGLEWEEPEIFDNFRVPRIMPEFAVESVGKLWVSTWDGLVGFDGQKWQQHDTDVDTDWLVKTSDDRLWTENSKMNVIASFNGQKWTAEFDIDNSLLDDAITSTAFVNSTGQILLGTDKGLFQYDPVLNSITDLKLGLVNVRRIYETTDQSLWVATDKGLFQLADGKWQESITDQTINVIQQTDQGQLWVATSNGLYQFHNGEWIRELTVPVNYFAELTDGILLVGGNDGLRIKPSANETIAMQIELAGEFVGGLFLASDDKLWCRSSAGIHSYDGLRWTNHEVPPEMDWDKGQLHRFPFMSNIYEDGNGIIWFNGSGSSRIASFRDGIVKTHPAFPSGGGYWSWSVLETKDGSILATGGIGAPFIYDGNDEDEWKSLPGYGKDKSDANIPLESSAVFQDNDGSIWFNGYQGIWRLHNGQWLEYRDIESKSVPLGEHFIRGPNGILRATTNRGIYRLNSAGKWVVEWKGKYI